MHGDMKVSRCDIGGKDSCEHEHLTSNVKQAPLVVPKHIHASPFRKKGPLPDSLSSIFSVTDECGLITIIYNNYIARQFY